MHCPHQGISTTRYVRHIAEASARVHTHRCTGTRACTRTCARSAYSCSQNLKPSREARTSACVEQSTEASAIALSQLREQLL